MGSKSIHYQSPLLSTHFSVSVQCSHICTICGDILVFPVLCNIVVCGTYNFLQKPAIIQKLKMADLNCFHNLKWHNTLHYLSKMFILKNLITVTKLKMKKCCIVHIRFSCQCNIVVCTVHTTFFDIVQTTISL